MKFFWWQLVEGGKVLTLVLVLERYNLCMVLTPKVASTTMLKFSMSLCGVEIGERNPRKYARKEAKHLEDRGLIQLVMPSGMLCKFAEQHTNYKWVAVTRNPYSRAISSYKSKVQRYAREFQFSTYIWTGLIKTLKGPKSWDDSQVHAVEVAKRISFVEFLNGLRYHGLNWNNHFKLQACLLALTEMRYDFIIKQEELDEGVKLVAQSVGLSGDSIPSLSYTNVSSDRKFDKDSLSDEEQELVWKLYKKDFDLLGYEY